MQKSKHSKSVSSLIDQKFWQNFAKNIWEKKPLMIKNFPSSLLEMGEEEVFDLLVLYANKRRKLNDPTGFKFYIDGFKVNEEEVLQILPTKQDKSLVGYHNRMKAMFSDYCLVCDELLTVNSKRQHLLTEFTEQLYRHVGFPNRFSEIGLYLGNYRRTP
ncbi:MAG: RNA methylase, partial [Bdellovibrio sp.]